MVTEDIPFVLKQERIRSVFRHAPLTHGVTIINAILVAIILADADDIGLLVSWTAALIVVSVVRLIVSRVFLGRGRLEQSAVERWVLFSVLGALTTGVLWGIGATALFPLADVHQLFLALVVAGMCAGAVTVGSAHVPTVLAFLLPASLPLAASFLAQGPPGRVSALMVVIFAIALSVISLAAHRTFGERIQLQNELGQEQHKLREANARLVAEEAQRRTAEATLHQAQKMEAIGHLTGGIAHDFNNLLQVMVGNIDLIRRLSADNPRVLQYAQAAEQAAKRGAELSSSLLTFARRQTLEALPVDINVLLLEFKAILLRTLNSKIRFEMTLAPNLPQSLADAAQFQSAILNLLINARDAMPDGGILSVATSLAALGPADLIGNADASPGDFVSVLVRDTGLGISPEVMVRVFEPFFTTKEFGKGTGLGLSQVYGFARQSHGHIGLVSALNEGTVVTLWLPVFSANTVAGRNAPGATAIGDSIDERSAAADLSGRRGLSKADNSSEGNGPHATASQLHGNGEPPPDQELRGNNP